MQPLIGITVDLEERRGRDRMGAGLDYAECVHRAGGSPILLPPLLDELPRHLQLCSAFVLIGGDDPIMEGFGEPTHPKATPVRPARQEYELALLRNIDPSTPVLGVCFGMQLMALVAGGALDQHMPETMENALRHWEAEHPVQSLDSTTIESGRIYSRHRQRVLTPGAMTVIARSDDDVIEAIADPARPYYIGVQWHPERTEARTLGQGLFDRLVEAARRQTEEGGRRHFETARGP